MKRTENFMTLECGKIFYVYPITKREHLGYIYYLPFQFQYLSKPPACRKGVQGLNLGVDIKRAFVDIFSRIVLTVY